MKEEYKSSIFALLMTMTILAILFALMLIGYEVHKDEPSELTKVCRDGKLYEVTHEGNITIFDRSAFMTCEETK